MDEVEIQIPPGHLPNANVDGLTPITDTYSMSSTTKKIRLQTALSKPFMHKLYFQMVLSLLILIVALIMFVFTTFFLKNENERLMVYSVILNLFIAVFTAWFTRWASAKATLKTD